MASDDGHISRREFFSLPVKAAAAGAVAASVAGASVTLEGCGEDDSTTGELEVIDVPEDNVVTLDAFKQIDKEKDYCTVTKLATLPAGTMLYATSDTVAAALCTGETASPLSTAGLFSLTSGTLTPVLDEAVGHDEGYSIFDVRASNKIFVWVESNYLTSDWRVYCASLRGATGIGSPVLVDEGDAEYDPPEIAAVGERAYWIVEPATSGTKTQEDSYLKTASDVGATAEIITSRGRFNGGLQVSNGILCAMPRAYSSGTVYYRLAAVEGATGSLVDSIVMPRSFAPGTAIYMDGNFAFTIEAGYDYGGGIANVGTYYPLDGTTWLRLVRTPITAPGLCRDWLFSKSGSRTVFVDRAGQRYFTVNPPDNSEDYGDYHIQVGETGAVYTYATVTSADSDDTSRSVVVRKIEPVYLS